MWAAWKVDSSVAMWVAERAVLSAVYSAEQTAYRSAVARAGLKAFCWAVLSVVLKVGWRAAQMGSMTAVWTVCLWAELMDSMMVWWLVACSVDPWVVEKAVRWVVSSGSCLAGQWGVSRADLTAVR